MKCRGFCIESQQLDYQRATVHDLNTILLAKTTINSIALIQVQTKIHEQLLLSKPVKSGRCDKNGAILSPNKRIDGQYVCDNRKQK
jgi:hypothetical protein